MSIIPPVIQPGDRYNRLTVLSIYEKTKSGTRWLCRCDCGKEKIVFHSNLRNGDCQSCGCLIREKTRQRHTEKRLSQPPKPTKPPKQPSKSAYRILAQARLRSMIIRCTDTSHWQYPDYGARGITVCERWIKSLDAFISDMGPMPTPFHTIERIDNDKGYCPENCRWATRTEQARNTRRTVWITAGDETHCLIEWEEITGVPRNRISRQLKNGFPPEQIFKEYLNKKES